MTEEMRSPTVLCDVCDEAATRFCDTCKLKLCTFCHEAHNRQKVTTDHILTDIEKVKLSNLNITCSICEEQANKFCPECILRLCTQCAGVHHKLCDIMATSQQHCVQKTFDEYLNNRNQNALGEKVDRTRQKINSAVKSVDSCKICSVCSGIAGPIVSRPQEAYFCPECDVRMCTKCFEAHHKLSDSLTLTKQTTQQSCEILNEESMPDPDETPIIKTESDKREEVITPRTYASELVRILSPIRANGEGPDIFALPMQENKQARDDNVMTKKYEIGSRTKEDNEKTIIFVGATGTGKSTLVNWLANYIVGVRLNDPFRFTLIEEEKQNNQAVSQTDWITTYSFNPQPGTRLRYRLNVIDTPGFGDTRGFERDHEIVDQFRHFFEAPGETGVQTVDAVCFFIKAPDSRYTAKQIYIFNTIISLFGKDVDGNICTLITFADGSDPPVLSAVNASGLPFRNTFTFNKSALFSNVSNIVTSTFWKMGMQSFKAVIARISSLERKSLQLTKEVLQERHRLELIIPNLQLNIKAGLDTIERLNSEVTLFQDSQNEMNRNANFSYEVKEVRLIKEVLPTGKYTMNCLSCNRNCHETCEIPDDDTKRTCWAMDPNGYCKQCPNKCYWELHKSAPFKFNCETVKVTKTLEDIKKKYEDAQGKSMYLELALNARKRELEDINLVIERMVDDMKICNNRLKEISLCPNPLGMVAHIDLLIQAEKDEGKPGYQGRIEVLQQFRDRADIGGSVDKFRQQNVSVKISLNESVVLRKKKGFFFPDFFNRSRNHLYLSRRNNTNFEKTRQILKATASLSNNDNIYFIKIYPISIIGSEFGL